jgi:hypothetical protein
MGENWYLNHRSTSLLPVSQKLQKWVKTPVLFVLEIANNGLGFTHLAQRFPLTLPPARI